MNYKAPDYTGHVFGMFDPMTGDALRDVDEQLGRLVAQLDALYPGRYALIVTADHGQCPLPDASGGVRLDPIQLWDDVEREFGGGLFDLVQNVVPSEVYLHADVLWDVGATREDVAAFLRDYPYRRNIGPYVPRDAIEQELLDRQQFAAVFATTYLDTLAGRDLGSVRAGDLPGSGDRDPGPGPVDGPAQQAPLHSRPCGPAPTVGRRIPTRRASACPARLRCRRRSPTVRPARRSPSSSAMSPAPPHSANGSIPNPSAA